MMPFYLKYSIILSPKKKRIFSYFLTWVFNINTICYLNSQFITNFCQLFKNALYIYFIFPAPGPNPQSLYFIAICFYTAVL